MNKQSKRVFEQPVLDRLYTIEITDLNHEGEGVGRITGFVTFVPDAIPGDRVEVQVIEVKKNFARAKIIKMLENSSQRIAPYCSLSTECGGCQLQAMDYQAQLTWKQNQVEQALARIGKLDVSVMPIIGMKDPTGYRNKAQFPVGTENGKTVMGFYKKGTHDIVEFNECSILHSLINKLGMTVKELIQELGMTAYNPKTKQGVLKHVIARVSFAQDKLMVIFVTGTQELPMQEELVSGLKSTIPELVSIAHNINSGFNKAILGKETKVIWGEEHLLETIGDLTFAISPASFFQVNPVQTKVLYDLVREYAGLSGSQVVWDLYCGTGSIGLYLASDAKKVFGVETLPVAVNDAKLNADLNRIAHAEFLCGKVEDILPRYGKKGEPMDVVVVDPPRKGCEVSLLDTIITQKVPKVVYVSCNPTTLARDLAYLSEAGYQVKQVQPVDMFPMTSHVECVVLLSRATGV